MGELLSKLEAQYGINEGGVDNSVEKPVKNYDVLIVGGGPAGAASAIYSARKGLNVAVIAERIGGQVKETVGIENLISVPQTTGQQLANDLLTHINDYPVDILEHRRVDKVELDGSAKLLTTSTGERFSAPALIVATGASWRKLNVPGEADYIGKGVAFCPHCDGPFYKGKHVAVVGGGNSGIEAAIDLAGICSKVTVLEFMDELKADHELVITLEDGVLDGGFGEKIARYYGATDMKVLNYGAKKEFVDRYDIQELLRANHLTDEQIVEDILSLIG